MQIYTALHFSLLFIYCYLSEYLRKNGNPPINYSFGEASKNIRDVVFNLQRYEIICHNFYIYILTSLQSLAQKVGNPV